MNSNFNTGERIRELRMEQGLSQEQLALRAEMTPTYLGLIERNKKNPTIRIVEQICNALNISLTDFFNFSEKPLTTVDILSKQILAQISERTEDEKQMLLQLIKNLLKFRDSPNPHTQK